MWWIISIIVWFIVGLVSTLIGAHVAMTERGGMTLSDCLVGLMWLLIGPLLWLSIGYTSLRDWIDNNSTKMIFKAKWPQKWNNKKSDVDQV